MDLFSSAFDDSAVEFLERMNVPAHKVASFELVDIGLIQKMARTGKPLIMSTGMASEEEISEAVNAARAAGATQIALLKCTSAYPAPPDEANLRTIPELARRFDCPAGLSDHTMGIAVPVVAVALGACIIEKHFVYDVQMVGRMQGSRWSRKNSRRWWRQCVPLKRLLGRCNFRQGRARPIASSSGVRCLRWKT